MSPRLILTLLALLAPAAAARGHDLQAKVTVAADHVRVEAFYQLLGDESPAEGAAVTLRDAAGAVVHAGKADARGVWTCPRPAAGAYTVVVEEPGHRAEVRVEVPAAGRTAEYRLPRLDPRLAAAIGLGLIALVTLAVMRLRRPRPVTGSPPRP
jgi:hypothetical protein